MGGGKGGGGTSTQYSGVQIPQEVLQRYNKATDRAETTSQQPWANYGGEFVAPVNATQTGGYDTMMAGQNYTNAGWQMPNQTLSQGVGAAAPLLNQASGSINTGQAQGQALTAAGLGQAAQAYAGAQPYNQQAFDTGQAYNAAATGMVGGGTQNVDPSQLNLQQFLNPYQQQVTEATMAQLGQQQAQQRMDQRGSMIREGSFGGDRSGVANANLVNQQNMATAQTLGQLNTANYGQALGAAQQQQGVGLGAAQANRGAQQWGSGQLGQLGQQGYSQALGVGNQQYQQGMGTAGFTGQMGQQAYGQGVGAGQAQAGLGQAQYGMYGDVAAKQAALANQAFTQNMQTAQGQIGFGSLQQQTQQAQDSALYNQWMQERGYPFQTSQFYTNAVMGTGPLSGSSAYSGAFTPQPFFSDERLKENMQPIGTTHDGQVIYRYNFKGQPGATQIGLSAQEVERKHPEAVTEHGGAKAVDYSAATEDAVDRPHKQAGGPLGSDVFGYKPPTPGLAPGVGILGQPASMPTASATPVTGGNIGDIVALQRQMLGANAPGAKIGPPSDAGITTPGAPPSGAAAPAAPASPVAAAVAGGLGEAGPRAVPSFIDPGGSANGATGDSSGSPGGEAGSVGAGVGTAAGEAGATSAGGGSAGSAAAGVGGDDGGTYAAGGGVGLGRAAFAKGGDAEDFWMRQRDMAQKMYGVVPWAMKEGAAGTGSLVPQLQQAKASQLIKPPEFKQQAQQKTGAEQSMNTANEAIKTAESAEKAYGMGKDVLVGSPGKGTPAIGTPGKPGYVPASPDYKPPSEGWFGKGGVWDRSKPADVPATTPAAAPTPAPAPVSPAATAPPTTVSATPAAQQLPTAPPTVEPKVSDAGDTLKGLDSPSTDTSVADTGSLFEGSPYLAEAATADGLGEAGAGLETGSELADAGTLVEDTAMFAAKGGRIGYSGVDKDSSAIPFGKTSVLPEGVYDVEDPSKLVEPDKPKSESSSGKSGDGGKGKAGGALAGAAAGAAIGSIVPGIGTLAGAGLGGMLGGSAGTLMSASGGAVEGDDIPLRDPGLGSSDTEPQSLYGPGGPGAADLEYGEKATEDFPWDMQSQTRHVPPPKESGVPPSKRHYENSRTYNFADGGEVNDNEPPEPGLAPAAEAVQPPDNVHWGVFSRSQGHKMVGRATTRRRARSILDKRDNEYGAYDHFLKPIPPARKRYAGGRLAFAEGSDVDADEAERKLVEESLRRREAEAQALGAARTAPEPAKAVELSPAAAAIEKGRSEQEQAGLAGADKGYQVVQAAGAPPPPPAPPPAVEPPDPGLSTKPLVLPKDDSSVVAGQPGLVAASTAPPPPPPPATTPAAPPAQVGPSTAYNIGGVMDPKTGTLRAPASFNHGVALAVHTASSYPGAYNNGQPMTIAQIGAHWAPVGAANDPTNLNKNWIPNVTAAYAESGFDPNKPIDFSDPKQAAAYARAVNKAEQGKAYDLSVYAPGVAMANDPKARAGFGSGVASGVGNASTKAPGAPVDTTTAGDTTPTGLGASDPSDAKSMYGQNKDWWDRNEGWTVPLITGIGGMLSSPSRTLLGSIGTGMVAGAGQYATLGQRQQQIDVSKQAQNIATVGKIQDSMNQISREKAGILLDNPLADVSAYDKSYKQMQAQQLKLLGVMNVGLGLPPQMADWLKTQPQEIQAFTARVHQSDNPFTLYRIAAGTQDPNERARIMDMAKAASDRATSGPVKGKDGSDVILSQSMINQLLQMRTRTAEASAAGSPEVWQQQLSQAQDDYNAWARTNPNPNTPELQAKEAELKKRIADLQAKVRGGGGGGQRAAGGRVGRADGGMMSADQIPTEGDQALAEAAPAPEPLTAMEATKVPAGPAGIVAGKPSATPVATEPPKPAATPVVKRDEHDSAFWYNHAQKMDAVGNKAAAEDSRGKAKAIEEKERGEAITTTTGPDGKPTYTFNPQVAAAKERESEQKIRAAQNQKLKEEAYRQSVEGARAEEIYQSGYDQMFDKNGNARMPMGPATEGSKKVAAFLAQFLPEQLIKDMTGLDPANAAAFDKTLSATAQALAQSNTAGRPTEEQFMTYMRQSAPNLGMPAAAAKFMYEHHLLPQARFNKGIYNVVKGKDPVTSNFQEMLHDYSIENRRVLPGALRGTEPEATPDTAIPMPADIKDMKVGQAYEMNGQVRYFGRDGQMHVRRQ